MKWRRFISIVLRRWKPELLGASTPLIEIRELLCQFQLGSCPREQFNSACQTRVHTYRKHKFEHSSQDFAHPLHWYLTSLGLSLDCRSGWLLCLTRLTITTIATLISMVSTRATRIFKIIQRYYLGQDIQKSIMIIKALRVQLGVINIIILIL